MNEYIVINMKLICSRKVLKVNYFSVRIMLGYSVKSAILEGHSINFKEDL